MATNTYIALIHKDPDSDYGASFPDLPGCVAMAPTTDEARSLIAEAIEFLAAHPEQARAMGARGRLAVDSRYNWQHEEQVLLGMYNRMCHVPESLKHLGSEVI